MPEVPAGSFTALRGSQHQLISHRGGPCFLILRLRRACRGVRASRRQGSSSGGIVPACAVGLSLCCPIGFRRLCPSPRGRPVRAPGLRRTSLARAADRGGRDASRSQGRRITRGHEEDQPELTVLQAMGHRIRGSSPRGASGTRSTGPGEARRPHSRKLLHDARRHACRTAFHPVLASGHSRRNPGLPGAQARRHGSLGDHRRRTAGEDPLPGLRRRGRGCPGEGELAEDRNSSLLPGAGVSISAGENPVSRDPVL